MMYICISMDSTLFERIIGCLPYDYNITQDHDLAWPNDSFLLCICVDAYNRQPLHCAVTCGVQHYYTAQPYGLILRKIRFI